MILQPLSLEDMEQIRIWRNQVPETLRTPFMLTREQQEQYYVDVICDRKSTTRYWGLWVEKESERYGPRETFIGYGGIENIEWENRIGEISVLIAPEYRGQGYGKEAVYRFLDQAFGYMGLMAVHGECYTCSPAIGFWEKLIDQWEHGFKTELPCRKYWESKL